MSIKAIELNKKISTIFSDKKRDISIERLKDVCLIGQGEKTCRYIMRNSDGYSCVKNSIIQVTIDGMTKRGSMVAKGNNCEGLVIKEENDNNEKEIQQEILEEKNQEENNCFKKEDSQEEANEEHNKEK